MKFNFLNLNALLMGGFAVGSLIFSDVAVGQNRILGDCGGQKCEQLLTQLQRRWPVWVRKYQSQCTGKNTLGLQVYANSPQNKRVAFNCWEPKNANNSRMGNVLGVLPFPGHESKFKSEWQCSDKVCKDTLAKLRGQYAQKLKDYEFECATLSGDLLINPVANSNKVEIECGFFAANLFDDNGDGISDGDRQTTVGKIMGTLQLPGR
ncbi:hypothetical protein NG798_12285 [Ancylothrix sp. C2]|uniref:hypothetical protein n=1 Tax=Ancylothrix sp. D3o TaxID=2953691 RepID=UPI0021BB1BF5|nr:hypothetical protein [Ancylothrix sp. D3o]MCT7950571.1 hypothetical protein [Ancylothrix sp. D3o]